MLADQIAADREMGRIGFGQEVSADYFTQLVQPYAGAQYSAGSPGANFR